MTSTGDNAKAHLKSFIERIERIEDDIKGLQEDRKDIYTEAKSNGFDVRTIREIIRKRKLTDQERREREDLISIYMEALGMLSDTPLGQSALERDIG